MSRTYRFNHRRLGASSLEVVVAFTLLTSVLALAAPLIVAHNRLLIAQRHYRVALAEISNQLERLSLLSATELPAAVEKLTPSDLHMAASGRHYALSSRRMRADSRWFSIS